MQSIEIDEKVHDYLVGRIKRFGETPNDVLKRELDLDDAPQLDDMPAPSNGKGMIQREYRPYIEKILREHGGKAKTRVIKRRMKDLLKDRFSPWDLDHVPSGAVRWWNNAQWERQHMVDDGILVDGSPVGTWELKNQDRDMFS